MPSLRRSDFVDRPSPRASTGSLEQATKWARQGQDTNVGRVPICAVIVVDGHEEHGNVCRATSRGAKA
jgi:hypothetical protein